MADLIGRRLDRYEVLSLLGAGGMGRVYRAKDLELDRLVAIKVIPDLAEEGGHRLERFNREIRTVAALEHPNIVRLHDFGNAEGYSYAVMELLKGRDLRQMLRGRPLRFERALEIGAAVAEGLGAAHNCGVIHRDIKPENIFVTSKGEVKILDFGLARFVEPAEPEAETASVAESLTSPGAILGTTGYQSPEQVRGLEVDQRSDIFSIGCVLYEMLTGSNPFRRDTRVDTLSAILNYEPEPLTERIPSLPPAVDLVIDRCLHKDASQRFESARDVAFAMRALSADGRSDSQEGLRAPVPVSRKALRWFVAVLVICSASAGSYLGVQRLRSPDLPAERHLAVVPFEVGRSDTDLRMLADGLRVALTDSLTTVAAQTRGAMWLLSRQDTRTVSGGSLDGLHRKYAINLGLTGHLEGDGDRLRLKLSLVEVPGLRVLREATFDDTLDNPAAFQMEAVLRLADMLGVPLTPATREDLEARSTNSAVAFAAYIRGEGLLSPSGGVADLDAAEPFLQEAIDADPGYLPPREAMASLLLRRFTATGDRQMVERGLQSIAGIMKRRPTERAFQLEADLRAAEGDRKAAAGDLLEAVRRFPGNGLLQLALGDCYHDMGRADEAERSYERAINLLPGYWPPHFALGLLAYEHGRYDAAANQWRAIIRCAPEFDAGYINLGIAYYALDRHDDAREMFERALELSDGTDYMVLSNLGTLYFEASRFGEAAELFERALQEFDGNHAVWGNLGEAYAATRQPGRAERPFRRAVELAESELEAKPNDTSLLAALASYHAMLGEPASALSYLDAVIALEPTDPGEMVVIGETYEDLGMREPALEWVGRALAGGVPASRFESRPSMGGLVDDPRYDELVSGVLEPRPPRTEGGAS